MLPVLISAIMPGSKWDIRDSEMKTLTDDPDWARDIFEARVLAMMFVRKYGRALQGSPCLQASGNGLTFTFYPNRSPLLSAPRPTR